MLNEDSNELKRTVSWTVGLSVALGVPLLIVPSIEYFTIYLGAASVLIWIMSVMQGFIQNLAYGELATDFPQASGIPGFSQTIMSDTGKNSLSALGGFSAWAYWFSWAPMPAIFTLSITDLITGVVPAEYQFPRSIMVMLVGCLILGAMLLLNRRGLSNNAKMGYLINFISLAPIILIAVLPFISGKADITNVTSGMLSGSLFKDANPVLLVFGLFGMAQWSACAWETAAMYGPQYMNPQKDTPRALISCGLICLVVFALVQFSCVSTLGTKVIDISTRPAMLMLAETDLGRYGGALAAAVMIIAMLSIIKTGFVGASHAMYSMSAAGNLPAPLGKLNEFGVPQNAMTATVILNIFLLLLNSSSAIVAASSVGYCFANGICLFSYVKYKRAKNKMEKRTGFCMPKYWYVLALVFAVLDVFVFSTGLLYLNWLDYGWVDLVLCVVILGAYFPLRNYAKHKWNISEAEAEEAA